MVRGQTLFVNEMARRVRFVVLRRRVSEAEAYDRGVAACRPVYGLATLLIDGRTRAEGADAATLMCRCGRLLDVP